MRILLSNHASAFALAERYPGRVGHLYSLGEQRGPYPELPFALDNGAYLSRKRGGFDSKAVQFDFLSLCERYVRVTPGSRQSRAMWLAVPDAVGNRERTLELWGEWYYRLRAWYSALPPLAFVVQDGMSPDDVPSQAEVVFVGGSTRWKWDTLSGWCDAFPRVHVGRVNSPAKLDVCYKLGVESIDGTGWARATQVNPKQWGGLIAHLEATTPRAAA